MVQYSKAEVNTNISLTEHTGLRIVLLSRGFEPIPIETETKRPLLKGWSKIELSNTVIRSWENRPDLGSSVRYYQDPSIYAQGQGRSAAAELTQVAARSG